VQWAAPERVPLLAVAAAPESERAVVATEGQEPPGMEAAVSQPDEPVGAWEDVGPQGRAAARAPRAPR
jgi:hypothetical protein